MSERTTCPRQCFNAAVEITGGPRRARKTVRISAAVESRTGSSSAPKERADYPRRAVSAEGGLRSLIGATYRLLACAPTHHR